MSSDTPVSSLDDELKRANIEKTKAESDKLKREATLASANARSTYWAEMAKIIGGVILGFGGLVAAYTQFEVAELRATAAKKELAQAQVAQAGAEKEMEIAFKARDTAVEEHKLLEKSNAQYRTSLAQTDSALRTAQPDADRPRLAYIQFRGDLPRGLIDELRNHLKTDAFNAPGAERLGGDYSSRVKYFTAADAPAAEKLAKSVQAFFATKGCALPLSAELAKPPGGQTPPLEVWLSGSCKG